jgi:asparagine synthase (glutamine-hydrolysing)
LNFKFNLPDDYLVKVDRMSMANSLETRAPFLDHRLIEFMVKVDKNVKLQGWERKSVLRTSIGKQLPRQLLKVPKRGFGVPLREWFKKDYNSSKFELENIKSVCDSITIKQIIDDNTKGVRDNGNFLWTLILLDKFLKL